MQDALERALKTMEDYASNGSGLAGFQDYFRYGNANRIVIISVPAALVLGLCLIVFPVWIGYLLLQMIKIAIILPWIDPDYWNRKFTDYMGDVEWCKHLLQEAGL